MSAAEPVVNCPRCGAEIPFTEAVSQRIREELRVEHERWAEERSAALAAREAKLAGQEKQIAEEAQSMERRLREALDRERDKLKTEAGTAAAARFERELAEMRETSKRQQAELQKARDAELALRRRKAELEEQKAGLELTMARRLDEERDKIAAAAREQVQEHERLKRAEHEHTIKALREQIAALQQRAAQGSMQVQGEAGEELLQGRLTAAFPYDDIQPVKQGTQGADLKHVVRTNAGAVCGTILWESKTAKNWSPAWVTKLKEDQRAAAAEVAILVCGCLPEGVRGFGDVQGVWLCEPAFVPAVAGALRQGLVAAAMERSSGTDRASKEALLYEYMTGLEFRQHIEGIVDAFTGLQTQLEQEKRAFQKQWAQREQQLLRAVMHAAQLYGGIQGIAGTPTLPDIDQLRLAT